MNGPAPTRIITFTFPTINFGDREEMSDKSSMPKDGDEAPDKKSGGLGRYWAMMSGSDRVLSIFFFVWLVLMVVFVLATYSAHITDMVVLVPLLGGLLAVFFMVGIPAAIFHWRKGIVSTGWLILVLVILSLAYMGGLYAIHGSDRPPAPFDDYGSAGEFAYFYLFAFVVLLLYIFVGFGMMWLLSFIQRLSLLEYLDELKGITAHDTGKKTSWMTRIYWRHMLIKMVFNLPDHLDTATLHIRPGKRRKGFPWVEFQRAFGWNMVFGIFITMLIALNPFLKDLPAFQDIFDISAFISFFVPLLVLSWFIFKRLDVRIKGPVKDFKLYEGLRSRVTRSVLALSTLIIFIRLALQTMDIRYILWQFFQLLMDFTAVVVITTFVYFNYFEEDIAEEVARDWTRGEEK
jgi:hypothetical protein